MARAVPAALPSAGRGRAALARGVGEHRGRRTGRRTAAHGGRSTTRPTRPTRRSGRWPRRPPSASWPRSRCAGRRAADRAGAAVPRRRAARRRASTPGWRRGTTAGVLEPSAADAVRDGRGPPGVAPPGRAHGGGPRRRSRDGAARPAAPLGRPVAAVDLPRAGGVGAAAARRRASGAGRMLVPVRSGATGRTAGADLLAEVPAVADWLAGAATAAWWWATTSTPTAAPTCASPSPPTRSPRA